MNDFDFKAVLAEIRERVWFVPEYFFCKHPSERAPIRFLVNHLSSRRRKALGDSMRARGYVVKYWRPFC